jgi:predicted amidohydrolase
MGVTPGVNLPVFKTDFGNVGIMTCYDSWFPETARLLAYKGAELILLPNAGYDMELMPARAADNGVCVAVSSENCPAGIWDSGGARAGEKAPDPTRYASTSIKSVEQDDSYHLLMATLDLSKRWSPHCWGGPMLSAPGGRRLRQTRIVPLEDEIAREAKRWWTSQADEPTATATITTTLQTDSHQIRQFAFDGDDHTFFLSAQKPGISDHFTLVFDKPVAVKTITAVTGRPAGGDVLETGLLETSADGKTFTERAMFRDGKAIANPGPAPITAVRITPTKPLLHPLAIREITIESEPTIAVFQSTRRTHRR